MCGLFGVILRDRLERPDEKRVICARDSLTHRGPDESGVWIRDGVALAHRRLKVLDLIHGQQPIVIDNRLAMVYNGEIYNFRDLRKEFEDEGDRFTSECDTEVVFHALNQEWPGSIDRFNGMFAIAHWDDAERMLLLVRDRLGQKPLYWYADDEQLVFASELKAILIYLQRKFDVSATALEEFFTRGYILSPRTIFKGIQKLPAGHRLILNARNWTRRVDRWWDIMPIDIDTNDEPGVIDQLDELLTDAVRIRLVSDVPLGCLLSGGIDSSLITAMAAKSKTGGDPLNTFSIGFESESHNELPFAKMVAQRYGCRWETRMMTNGDFLADLEDAGKYFDEPFGNFTVTSQRTLSKLCRESLTVVLSGQGGDELTAGYPGRYNWVLETQKASEGDLPRTGFAAAIDDPMHYLHRS
ncbi:MAG: asparagine synthase (glutamine-hydrolyzing), partial [Planctomycetota bacterium]|nr:asparagine synthase (glutamine-hydrolyzing) [Planctomycetota bacterium]